MTLVRGVYSVTTTRRRRFLWCAWWTGSPVETPFRAPDAWNGGAKTAEEAKQAAESAAGQPLEAIEGRWAGAWVRVRAGQPPFPKRDSGVKAQTKGPRPVDPHATLGVAPGASADELKAAFRRRALEAHPDHGGDDAAFIALKRAYDALVRRQKRRAP